MELHEDEPAEELDADDNDDNDEGVCFSKLEAAELETDDEPDEFCPHDLSYSWYRLVKDYVTRWLLLTL